MILVSQHPGESRGALGVVTLEDVIEEMIGEEIVDETDVFVDVHNKIKVVRNRQTANNAAGQNWQPLIRGIIERRRKLGGPMKAPLRSSYGTIGIMDNGGSAKNDNKYGLPSSRSRAVDKVAIKRLDRLNRSLGPRVRFRALTKRIHLCVGRVRLRLPLRTTIMGIKICIVLR